MVPDRDPEVLDQNGENTPLSLFRPPGGSRRGDAAAPPTGWASSVLWSPDAAASRCCRTGRVPPPVLGRLAHQLVPFIFGFNHPDFNVLTSHTHETWMTHFYKAFNYLIYHYEARWHLSVGLLWLFFSLFVLIHSNKLHICLLNGVWFHLSHWLTLFFLSLSSLKYFEIGNQSEAVIFKKRCRSCCSSFPFLSHSLTV